MNNNQEKQEKTLDLRYADKRNTAKLKSRSEIKLREETMNTTEKMKYYLKGKETVLSLLGTSTQGLSENAAEERLKQNGPNKLKEAKGKSIIKRFAEQISDPMIIILLCAALVSGVLSVIENESFADVVIILAVVMINAVLGVYQENKAEQAIEALQQMAASTSKVIREGKITTIRSEDIVVGDIAVLEAGDAVPADARIIESASMKIEEAALTGESVPVSKFVEVLNLEKSAADIPLGDRKNMVYMGSTVVYGRGTAVVTATGMDTEMGKIAEALQNAQESRTPLQIRMAQLSKLLTKLVLAICIIVFAVQLLKSGGTQIDNILNSFMAAVSLAVAAIPEGLAAVVTVVLSIGVTNMSKKNAIIRKLTAVETLGCAQIICSDKTGTLTQNKMTVVDYFGDDETLLVRAMALCCDAENGENLTVIGEPTEAALVAWANQHGFNKNDLKSDYPRIGEAPFDSGRKMMSTVHRFGSVSGTNIGSAATNISEHAAAASVLTAVEDAARTVRCHKDQFVQFTKGAPDVILDKCTMCLQGEKIVPLTDSYRDYIIKENREMADRALRVLGCAMRRWDTAPDSFDAENLEHELIFVGLTGMIDPVRPEVKNAIAECFSAGIRPVMITGDHIDTACAIAKELGILDNDHLAITGTMLDEMKDDEYETQYRKIAVYARVQPEHKTRIVNAWRQGGFVTAMTGDGVNDAPSIKSADIGIGMGITGTDVTKNVADMVLADDNFATIVGAVAEGRRIYDNILKAIQFLLASNMSEVLAIFTATLMGFQILKPVHLLWINLVTDSFPALALGTEKEEPGIMSRKPRESGAGIFNDGIGRDIAYQGLLVTLLVVLSYFVGSFLDTGTWEITNSAAGTTMAFLTMSMAEIFHSLNMRSRRSSIFKLGVRNRLLIGAAAASLIFTTAVCEIPFLASAFGFTTVGLKEYAIAAALGFMVIPVVETVKLLQRKQSRFLTDKRVNNEK